MKKITIIKNQFFIHKHNAIFIVLFVVALFFILTPVDRGQLYELIKFSYVCATLLIIFHLFVLKSTESKNMILTDTHVEIDDQKIPWEQITKFNYFYGIANHGRHRLYEESISVRGFHNNKIYAFDYKTPEHSISAIDGDEFKSIKERIGNIETKSDDQALNFKRANLQFIYLSILSAILVVVNFVGLLSFLKFKEYSSITVSNDQLYLIFSICLLLLGFASFKAFINLDNYAFSEKYQILQKRLSVSLLLSLMTLFSSRLIISAYYYETATEYKTVEFKIVKTDIRYLNKNNSSAVHRIQLYSPELNYFFITHDSNINCSSVLTNGTIIPIKIYQTSNEQLFYIGVHHHSRECLVSRNL